MASDDSADGGGNFSGRQSGGCHLIQQGLEGVVISAVDQSNLDGITGKAESGGQSAKSGADNHDSGYGFAVHSISSRSLVFRIYLATKVASHVVRFPPWPLSRKV